MAQQGRFDAAIPRFQSAIRLKPDYAQAHFNLGLALAKAGQTEQAIAAFLKAKEIDARFVPPIVAAEPGQE